MKFRKARPSMAVIIGCRIVVSIAKRPDHGPENATAATSAHSSIVMTILLYV